MLEEGSYLVGLAALGVAVAETEEELEVSVVGGALGLGVVGEGEEGPVEVAEAVDLGALAGGVPDVGEAGVEVEGEEVGAAEG